MTERMWLDGESPAVATDTWAVMTAGAGAVPAARRILELSETAPTPADLLDGLLRDGIASAPAFAVVSLLDAHLIAFLRGPFVLRAQRDDGRITRLDGLGVYSWRETILPRIQRAWCLLGPDTPATPTASPAVPGPTTASGIALRIPPPAPRTPVASLAPAPAAAAATAPMSAAPAAVELPGGRRIPIDRELLIGRGPRSERRTGDELPMLVTLPDAPREVSRRHLRVWPSGGGIRIEDLGSSGGTTLRDPDGAAHLLDGGRPYPVSSGEVAELPGGLRLRFVADDA